MCAILHLYEFHCGKKVHIKSDGDLYEEGWTSAYQMILETFGVEYLTGCYYRRRSAARKYLGDKTFTLPENNAYLTQFLCEGEEVEEVADEQCILVTGNLGEGFEFHGPFDSFDDADEYSQSDEMNGVLSWVSTLNAVKALA